MNRPAAAPRTATVPDWLLVHARERLDALAIADAAERVSFGELERRSARMAAGLAAAGVGEGDVVALLASPSVTFVVAVHAARRIAAVILPLGLRSAPPELAWQVDDAHVYLIVHDASRAGTAAAIAGGRPTVGLEELLARPDESRSTTGPPLRELVDLAAPATIVHTSGTTGRSKGALLTHGNHRASQAAWASILAPGAEDRWLACLPFHHVAGLATIMRATILGVPLVVHDGFDPEAVDRAIDHEAISHLSVVGAMLPRLLDVRRGRPYPPTLRAVLLGGGPTPAELVREAIDRGLPLVPSYGLTETASGVCVLSTVEARRHPASSGRALPPAELRILGEDDPARAAGSGEIGEIVVRGPMVFAGYHRRPAETAAVLRDGWLHTGDLGTLDAEGRLTVADRRLDLVVSGGENVYPAEVEAVLLGHPDVVDAGVVGRADSRWGMVPVAAVVTRPGVVLDEDGLRAFCRERLAAYKVPVAFQQVDALPRTDGGKLLRRELRAPLDGPGR